MSTDHRTPTTRDEIVADIEQTRAELGRTVEELTARLDVKARVQQRVRSLPPAVPVAAGVAVLAAVGLLVWRRRR